jgi:hypothetical protein
MKALSSRHRSFIRSPIRPWPSVGHRIRFGQTAAAVVIAQPLECADIVCAGFLFLFAEVADCDPFSSVQIVFPRRGNLGQLDSERLSEDKG